ncbi:hypothetical protein AAVH_31483 [Aphelenchoides avenae]|nr:hypothetical protein AAVH_31483 [Aphelenchus avenae]
MPLYYDWHFVGAFVFTPVWMCLACYDSSWTWLHWLLLVTSWSTSCYCSRDLLNSFYHEWLEPPDLQFNNAEPANGNAAQLQRGHLRHFPISPRMLVEVFQCLPRAGLDACQLVSRQFRDAVEDARATLPLYSMLVELSPSTPLVEYTAWVVNVGSVAGDFFTGLRHCDAPYFRNAAIKLRTINATYARTSSDMISAFVRWLNLDERNILFADFGCEAYADELEDLFRFTGRHNIRSLYVIYKRSLVTPGCDFLSTLFVEARKLQLSQLTVAFESAKVKNCVSSFPRDVAMFIYTFQGMELQVGFQVLSELYQDQERPSAEDLTIVVPRLKGFRLLRRIDQAYTRGEITRPLTIGFDASIPLAELWPDNDYFVEDGKPPPNGPATMNMKIGDKIAFYEFSLPR